MNENEVLRGNSDKLQRMVMAAMLNTPLSATPTAEDRAREEAEREAQLPFAFRKPWPQTLAEAPEHLAKLREYFLYEPLTGLLRYRYNDPGSWRSVATRRGVNGYGRVKFYDLSTSSAAMVWLLQHGRWPVGKLKRRNGDVRDDRIENLYEPTVEAAVRREVHGSKPKGRRSPSRGVARSGPSHWQAYVRVDGIQRNLGRFTTEAEAIAARAAWDKGEDLV